MSIIWLICLMVVTVLLPFNILSVFKNEFYKAIKEILIKHLEDSSDAAKVVLGLFLYPLCKYFSLLIIKIATH